MNRATIAAAAGLLANIGLAAPGVAEAAAIKPGLWQFRTSLEPAAPALAAAPAPQRITPPSAGSRNPTARYTICVDPAQPLPAEFGPQCKLDRVDRRGARFSWSMICANSKGEVRSDGVAHYRGTTMEATMVSHLPARNGAVIDTTQHITGNYVGPCRQPADLPLTPSHLTPPPNDADTVEPAAATTPSLNPAAESAAASAPPPPTEARRTRHRHYAGRHSRRHRHGYFGAGGAAWGYAYGGYGPGP